MSVPEGCIESCRACSHRQDTKEISEQKKLAVLEKILASWLGELEPVHGVSNDKRWHYRGRACLRAEVISGAWSFGLLQDEEILAIPNCPLHSKRVNQIFDCLRDQIPIDLPLVFVVVNDVFVSLVFKCKERELARDWIQALWQKISSLGIVGLFANWNPSAGERVFNTKAFSLLKGQEWSQDKNGLFLAPDSFLQLLPELYEQALLRAKKFLGVGVADRVLDLYCGNGASCLVWESAGADFFGVELGGRSLAGAARRFGAERFLRGRVSERLPQIISWLQGGERVFANPPRLGLEENVVKWLNQPNGPTRLAYLSCNARTLARDLAALSSWRVQKLVPFDFFPQTRHCEVLALLER